MNRALMIWLSVATLAAVPARCQGTFQDLDFQDARLIFITNGPYSGEIATTNALPGWSAFAGTNQLSTVPHDNGTGNPPVQLIGTNAFGIIGNFAVILGPSGSISQAGFIPADAQSLLFQLVGNGLSLSLDGRDLPYIGLSIGIYPNGTYYTEYGADISAFAGRIETMDFLEGGPLDDIQFSSQPIPEPSALSLIVVAGGVLVSLGLRRRTSLVQSRPAGGCRT